MHNPRLSNVACLSIPFLFAGILLIRVITLASFRRRGLRGPGRGPSGWLAGRHIAARRAGIIMWVNGDGLYWHTPQLLDIQEQKEGSHDGPCFIFSQMFALFILRFFSLRRKNANSESRNRRKGQGHFRSLSKINENGWRNDRWPAVSRKRSRPRVGSRADIYAFKFFARSALAR